MRSKTKPLSSKTRAQPETPRTKETYEAQTRTQSHETPSASARVTVRDLMTADAVTVTQDASIVQVARLMNQHGITGLPVVDGNDRVIGMITDHDLIVRNTKIEAPRFLPFLEGQIPLESPGHFRRRLLRMVGTTAKDVMSDDVETIGPDEDVETLAERMIGERLKILPVVEDTRLVGVVTRADVIRWMVSR